MAVKVFREIFHKRYRFWGIRVIPWQDSDLAEMKRPIVSLWFLATVSFPASAHRPFRRPTNDNVAKDIGEILEPQLVPIRQRKTPIGSI